MALIPAYYTVSRVQSGEFLRERFEHIWMVKKNPPFTAGLNVANSRLNGGCIDVSD
jgi:hypothetical protein